MKRLYKHRKTEHKTYLYSDDMLLDGVDDLISTIKTNNKYDIPYLAGYNKEGNIIYIDKDVPKYYRYKGKKYSLYKYLIVHEVIEKVLEETIKLNYFYAHQMALRLERQVVEADGLDWKAYDDYCQQWIKEVEHEKIEIVPADLDLQPYLDGKDYKLIEVMKSKMEKPKVNEMEFIRQLM